MSSNGTIDRRARSTRDALGRALLSLGGMSALDRLSVGELARTAGIARSTFYSHYRGLDDYLARSFANMLASLARAEDSHRMLPVRAILAHVQAAGEGATRLAKGRHFAAMIAGGEAALRGVASARLALHHPALTEIDRRALATVMAAGFLAMLRDWLDQGRLVEPEEIARRFEAVEDRLTS
jgi:AcrR family transcriptional regulator